MEDYQHDVAMDTVLQPEKNHITDDVEGKIFIGGLSFQTTVEQLKCYFEKFGELVDVAIKVDKRTSRPRYLCAGKSILLWSLIFDNLPL